MGHDDSAHEPLALVMALCEALADEAILYCHWKSNEAIDRSATGENDLDLLVDRSDADRFAEVIYRLGFKQARPLASREVPGLIDYYGLDAPSGLLVHLQAHYQLVLGDDMTKNYHLPLEREYLESVGPPGLFRVPAPDFELAVFVVRMILKHASWDAQLCLLGKLSASEHRELDYLLALVPESERASAVSRRLPFLTSDLAEDCLGTVRTWPSARTRASVSRALERSLAPYALRRRNIDMGLRTVRRFLRAARHVTRTPARRRLVDGGALIAVVGPDSSRVTTVSDALAEWLDHALDVERFSFPDAADDSSSMPATYRAARRHAGNGGIAICAQFPVGRSRPDVLIDLAAIDSANGIDATIGQARSTVWAGL